MLGIPQHRYGNIQEYSIIIYTFAHDEIMTSTTTLFYKFAYLPNGIIRDIISYVGVTYKKRNGKYIGQIPRDDARYTLLSKLNKIACFRYPDRYEYSGNLPKERKIRTGLSREDPSAYSVGRRPEEYEYWTYSYSSFTYEKTVFDQDMQKFESNLCKLKSDIMMLRLTAISMVVGSVWFFFYTDIPPIIV